ncbi:hypothetical protein BDN70DRAFT_494159 [Pholiota conissans]|uniref:Uncharacterized protein n=1 Tax=Pholiota conissans TaxID=109636 RepID=A0A9P5YMW7_9AGAR|nr:hypothetical protein BDN70DRAFT_494159 [Pholiota conissans]
MLLPCICSLLPPSSHLHPTTYSMRLQPMTAIILLAGCAQARTTCRIPLVVFGYTLNINIIYDHEIHPHNRIACQEGSIHLIIQSRNHFQTLHIFPPFLDGCLALRIRICHLQTSSRAAYPEARQSRRRHDVAPNVWQKERDRTLEGDG